MKHPAGRTLYGGLGYHTKHADSEFRKATPPLVTCSLTRNIWLYHADYYTYDPAVPFDHGQLDVTVTSTLAVRNLQ